MLLYSEIQTVDSDPSKETAASELSTVLGQDQDAFGGGYQPEQSFSGKMARIRDGLAKLKGSFIVAHSKASQGQLWPFTSILSH